MDAQVSARLLSVAVQNDGAGARRDWLGPRRDRERQAHRSQRGRRFTTARPTAVPTPVADATNTVVPDQKVPLKGPTSRPLARAGTTTTIKTSRGRAPQARPHTSAAHFSRGWASR